MRNSIGALLACFVLASCSDERRDTDGQVFRYNEVSGVSSLDPAFAKDLANIQIVTQLYNALVQLDVSLNVQPAIAKRWQVSEDGLTYTFHLRDDVVFHNHEVFGSPLGRNVVAGDFVYSFGRIIDPQVASPGGWIFHDKVDDTTPFTAVDDTTFQLKLKRPFRPMLGILAMPYCFVVPREVVERYGRDYRSHPVGTGPFMLSSWREGEALILKRNANYFELDEDAQLPYLDEVVISFNDRKSTEFLAMLNGDLDYVSDIDPSLKDQVLTSTGELNDRYMDRLYLLKAPYLNTEYFGFLLDTTNALIKSSPLRYRKVRQAINHAIDRKLLVRFLRNGKGTPATKGMIPAALQAFDSTADYGYDYDPQRAAQLLAEADFPQGRGMSTIRLAVVPTYRDIGEFVQKQLGDIGIRIDVDIVQPAVLRNQVAQGQQAFFRASWVGDYPDAENYMALFYSKYGAPPNYTRYSNPQFDRLYEQAVRENDDDVRNQLYRQMDSLVMADAPVVPLYYDEVYRFVRTHVEGLEVNPMNILDLRRVRTIAR